MIIGEFNDLGQPFVEGSLFIPRFRIHERVRFLVDTGTDSVCLHRRDATSLEIPFDQLGDTSELLGVGGASPYFREYALMEFSDGRWTRFYAVHLLIAEPRGMSNAALPSLLGREILNQWRMNYDPASGRLEFEVRSADYTLDNL